MPYFALVVIYSNAAGIYTLITFGQAVGYRIGAGKMNVKERVLASRLVEKSKQNQKLAEQIGLNCKLSRMTAGNSQKPKTE